MGYPNSACNKLPNEFNACRSKDYFNLFLFDNFIKSQIINTSNFRAAIEGAGSTAYKDFVPFDLEEVLKFIGILYANAVSPKPQFQRRFMLVAQRKVFGNDAFAKVLDKHLPGSRFISGQHFWTQFC